MIKIEQAKRDWAGSGPVFPTNKTRKSKNKIKM